MGEQNEFTNLLIFVADSLRWDYLPESIASEGTAVQTLAAGLHTPVSFSSLLTGVSPEKHSVRGFEDRLDPALETVFDRFENGCYYDYELDPVRSNVLKDLPSGTELKDIEEPFVFVERAMESHTPYNEVHHGNELEHVHDGDYTRSFDTVDGLRDRYRRGVEGVESHFRDHLEELAERGILEDTLVVFTSDHGELLGERKNLRRRYAHGHPMSRELVRVPTVFYDVDIDARRMRMIDIVETCLQMTGRETLGSDGVDIRSAEPGEGVVVNDGYASYRNTWRFENGDWNPGSDTGLRKDVLREDLRILLSGLLGREIFSRPGKPEGSAGTDIDGLDV
ncbi:MAG: sulfatase-like hydrolase/transferase [Candidatus Nanohaloarchaea archaeon]